MIEGCSPPKAKKMLQYTILKAEHFYMIYFSTMNHAIIYNEYELSYDMIETRIICVWVDES